MISPAALVLVATIALPNVHGRIDHFAVDLEGRRLFVAALGNDTVEVIDIARNRHVRSLRGFSEPQGVGYVPGANRLYVANGRGNRVDVLDGKSFDVISHFERLEDADNVRFDGREVIVGYGEGALRILDARTGEIPLPGHPESFQLERKGRRIFVNVPSARQVAVVDRDRLRVTASWPVKEKANFPMALDEEGRRLFVGTRSPARLVVYDTDSGSVVERLPIGGDTDDVFFDAKRKRVYVVCGDGELDIFNQDASGRYSKADTVQTAPRARTGLFVPEEGRLYVAAPASGAGPARVLVYEVKR